MLIHTLKIHQEGSSVMTDSHTKENRQGERLQVNSLGFWGFYGMKFHRKVL